MDRKYEIETLWNSACTYSTGWQQHNCPAVRGDRTPLENAWIKLTKGLPEHRRDALMKKIQSAMDKQTSFRGQQRAAKEFVPQPVVMSKWINNKRWEREIVLQGEPEPEKKTGLCNCGAEINININLNGEPTGKCWACYDNLRAVS